jgi:predicted transcriptional regulator
MSERAKSFGSTVRKNKENAEIIMDILKIIAIANDKPFSSINRVLRTMIKM